MEEPTNLYESALYAADVFATFREGRPLLIRTGIRLVDDAIGGVAPGSCSIVALPTGVGKTRFALQGAVAAWQRHQERSGLLMLEDGPEVLGSRAMAMFSNIDGLNIRTKNLSPSEITKLDRAMERLKAVREVSTEYAIAAGLDVVLERLDRMADAGVKLVWLDYIQKMRLLNKDRRVEVGAAFAAVQARCARHGMALVGLSQFSRQDENERPKRWWLKESGDLENEARLIVLGWRNPDWNMDVELWIDKSTFGGEGLSARYTQAQSGLLEEVR